MRSGCSRLGLFILVPMRKGANGREGIQMRKFLGGAVALLALCGCNSTPQNPVDAAIVSPPPSPPTPPSPSGPPSLVAHQGTRLGVVFLPVSPGSATALKIGSDRGLIVRSVLAGGAAAKVGIVEGDVLFSVDGTPVNSLADLTAAVNAAAPHHSAEFEMSRDGATRDVTIPL
jgi:membrane-associated protease RseP (regulator of RpoE activity)